MAVLLFQVYYFPDFNPDSVAKVLELINSGATDLTPDDVQLRRGMISIIQSLQININLEPATRGYTKMASQNMPRNMDDLTDKIKRTPQKMSKNCDKSPMMPQKMAEACDKIRIADLCDSTEKNIEVPKIGPPEGLNKMPKYSTDSEMEEVTMPNR